MKRPSDDQSNGELWLAESVRSSSDPEPPAVWTTMSAWCLRSDWKATRDPSGDQIGPVLLLGPEVSFVWTPRATSPIQTSERFAPESYRSYATREPSGASRNAKCAPGSPNEPCSFPFRSSHWNCV